MPSKIGNMSSIVRKIPLRLNENLAKCLLNEIDNFLFDCDGVIWNWPYAIDGSIECINKLKSLGKRCFFVTNNSTKTRKMLAEQCRSIGIKNVTENEIVCTAWILASYLKSINFKDKAFIIGNSSIGKELDAVGIKYTGIGRLNDEYESIDDLKKKFQPDPNIKCVAVGFDYYFSYPKMLIGTTYACQQDCLFLATNDDSVFPSSPNSSIIVPGTGTFVNAMRTSVGRDPIILGKPYETMFSVLKKAHNLDESRTCMIGDRLETDIAFGVNCNMKYTLSVFTGITNENEIFKYANDDNKMNYLLVPDFYTDSLKELGSLI